MTRRSVTLVVAFGLLATALALPAAALAAPSHHGVRAGGPAARPPAPSNRLFAPRLAGPLGTLTGNATLKVHVYGFASNPEVGAEVDWWVTTPTDGASGFGFTDATGLATITGVPAAAVGQGEIAIYGAAAFYDIWNLDWVDPTGTDMGVQPGTVSIDLSAGGDWPNYGTAYCDLYSQNGDASQETASYVTQTGSGAGSVTTAAPLVLGNDLGQGAILFWSDEGTEVSLAGLHTSPGTSVASGLNVNQVDAQRVYNFSWASGKPGTKTTISFQNFPAGWANVLFGLSEGGGAGKAFGTWTALGGTGWVKRGFTIPTSAKPGFTYNIFAAHADGPLLLSEPFQVCTLNPSKASLAAPASIRFSGRVPFKKGSRKTVTLYRRLASAGQPGKVGGFSSWNGWRKVRTFKTDTLGRYRSPLVGASRTAWYVLWYSGTGDPDHWGAWTSVRKVVVR
jgi:hypothetical protein